MMITIDQLLESVDLEFEPRFVTKDKNGEIFIWVDRPEIEDDVWDALLEIASKGFGAIKLTEFENKHWTECMYEVPQKTTGNIKKIETKPCGEYATVLSLFDIALKVNEIIDKIETLELRTEDVCARIIDVERAVNELKGAKND